MNASGAMNTMPFSVDMQSALSSSLSKNTSDTTQAIQDASSSYQKSVSATASDMVQLGQQAGTTTTTGSGSSITNNSELAQSYNKALDVAQTYRKDNSLNVSDKQILQNMIEGGLQASIGLPEAAKAISPISASASVSGSAQSMSIHEVSTGANAYHDLSAGQRQTIDNLVRASQQYSSTQHSDISNTRGSSLSKDIQDNLTNMNQQSETVSSSMQKLTSYQQEAQVVNSSSFSSNEAGIYNSMFKDYLDKNDPSLAPVLLNNPNLSANQKETLDIYLQSFANQAVSSGSIGNANAAIAAAPSEINSSYGTSSAEINRSAGQIGSSFATQSGKTESSFGGGNVSSASSTNSQVSGQIGSTKASISAQGDNLDHSSSQISSDVNARFTKGDQVAQEGAVVGAAKSTAASLAPGLGAITSFDPELTSAQKENFKAAAKAGQDQLEDKDLNFTDPSQNINQK